MSDSYIIGQSYRSPPINSDEEGEFIDRINEELDTGISPFSGIKCIDRQGGDKKEFLVLYSNPRNSSQNPWEDEIDLEKGRVRYWGDAKPDDDKNYIDYNGNAWLKDIYEKYYLNKDEKSAREEAPPILVFESPEEGLVEFVGVCVIDDLHLEYFKHDGRIAANYLVELSILNAREVTLDWIRDRAFTGSDEEAPEAWKEWVQTGEVDRFSVHQSDIKPDREQLPEGEKRVLLESVREEFPGSELEYVVKHLLQRSGIRGLEIQGGSGDKGVDLVGRTGIFSDLDLSQNDAEIPVKVQVKNYKLETSNGNVNKIGPRYVSRLASRIGEGEIGIYVTTSAYSKQAQRETLSTYPVKLVSGFDLAEMLHRSSLTEGYELTSEAKEAITEEIERET